MKKTAQFLLISMFLVILNTVLVGAEQHILKINCTIHSPYEAFFFRLVEEICAQNSIIVKHNTPPVGRSLINVNQGLDDGDGPRIHGLSASFPNLICVPEPFGDFIFGAFVRDQNIKITDWSSLSDLNVAYIHGWKIFENNVTNAKSITKVKNAELLFKLLDAERTDAVLITKFAGEAMLQQLGIKNGIFVEPPLAKKTNYLYLNKQHEALAPTLAQTLRDLKSSGRYDKIYNEILRPSPNSGVIK